MDLRDRKFLIGSAFSAVEKLGEGSYGSVYKVIHSETKKEYAIKIIKEKFLTQGIPPTVLRELSLLKKLSHSNVIPLSQYALGKGQIEILLEYCQYDLHAFKHRYFNDRAVYNELTLKKIMMQIIQGSNYLHANLIMHRDLKPQNILLNYVNGEPQVKVSDLGLSRRYTLPLKAYTKEILTLYYRAPEVLLGQTIYSIAVDMWSIGCICVELFIDSILFKGDSDLELLERQFKVFGTFNEETFPGVTALPFYNPNFKKYEASGFKRLFDERSPFKPSDAFIDLIEKFLKVDPSKRITCKDALMHVSILSFTIT